MGLVGVIPTGRTLSVVLHNATLPLSEPWAMWAMCLNSYSQPPHNPRSWSSLSLVVQDGSAVPVSIPGSSLSSGIATLYPAEVGAEEPHGLTG